MLISQWIKSTHSLTQVERNKYCHSHAIARYDEIDTLREMVAQGFNVNSQDEFGTTALHNACANGYMYKLVNYS